MYMLSIYIPLFKEDKALGGTYSGIDGHVSLFEEGKLETWSRYFGNKQKGLIRECFRFSLTSSVQSYPLVHLYRGMYFSIPEGGMCEIRISRLLMYVCRPVSL